MTAAVIAAASARWWPDTALTCSRAPRWTDALEAVEVRVVVAPVEFRSELAPHPATTQAISNIAALPHAALRRCMCLTPPFTPRKTRQCVGSFQCSAVTNLTNRPAACVVRWLKLVKGGFRQ